MAPRVTSRCGGALTLAGAICLFAAGKVLTLAAAGFTLSWVHSVEKAEWRERWSLADGALVLTEAAVKGSGAGMDPGEGARLEDGWWVWAPTLPPQPRLNLAASGATLSGWTVCAAEECHEVGDLPGAVVSIAPCER